jgi:hypothetical protein
MPSLAQFITWIVMGLLGGSLWCATSSLASSTRAVRVQSPVAPSLDREDRAAVSVAPPDRRATLLTPSETLRPLCRAAYGKVGQPPARAAIN